MAQVNPLTREVLIKLVYYGPGLGGKTTTLQRVHGVSPAETRGKIVSLATPVDRTLYFDFLPLRVGPVKGYPVRLQLFTVPGQVYFNATRKLVLTGADGVVFVADSQRERQDANLESFQNLEANLTEQNRQLENIPHVFQLNKRDLPNVVPVEQLNESLNRYAAPYFASAAAKGEGALEPLDELVRLVLEDLEQREVFGDTPIARPRQPSFGPASEGLGESLSRASEELWTAGGSSDPPRGASSPQTTSPTNRGPRLASPPPNGTVTVPRGEEGSREVNLPPEDSRIQATPSPTARNHSSGPSPSRPLDTPATSPQATLSWGEWFEPEHRPTVEHIEQSLGGGEPSAAVGACEALVTALADEVARCGALPEAERSVTLVLTALGLPGERWLSLRSLAERSKQGEPISERETLEAYATAIEVQRLCRRLLR